jgi:hypothetical protein
MHRAPTPATGVGGEATFSAQGRGKSLVPFHVIATKAGNQVLEIVVISN